MRKILLILLFFLSLFSFSQREADNWYFGGKSGLYFNSGNLDVLNNSSMYTKYGSSSISDIEGKLLFYTNGITIWNKNHQVMENGENLAGDIENTQTSIIIPKPNDKTVYYIFTTKLKKSNTPLLYPGIYYSEIKISNTYPLGKVIIKNRRLENSTSQKITAVHHKNGKDIWVVSYGSNRYQGKNNIFFSWKVSEDGVNQPIKTKLNEIKSPSKGEMKSSPDGSKIALSIGDLIYIYNFNSNTGTLSRFKYINLKTSFTEGYSCYGLSFSSNSKYLYYSSKHYKNGAKTTYNIMQLDLANPVEEYLGKSVFSTIPNRNSSSLQLASDGKIYVSQIRINNLFDEDGFYIGYDLFPIKKIGVINEPNESGNKCDYKHDIVNLQKGESYFGLPNFIQSFFRNRIVSENKCVNDVFNFSLDSYNIITSAEWDFGDGNTTNGLKVNHTFSSPGDYIVKCIVTIGSERIPFYKNIKVYPLPKLISNQKLTQCDNDNDNISLFNLKNIESKLSNDNSLSYNYYKNLFDAENDIMKISDPENFYNTNNPQIIYVKAISKNGCSSINSFSIETNFQPLISISSIASCEYSRNDSTGEFNLEQKKQDLINTLLLTSVDKISFYESYNDAQKSLNKLPNLFKSLTTTIWVKIENKNKCSGIHPIELIVNKPPLLNLNNSYTICINPSLHPPITLTADLSNDRFEWKDENDNILNRNHSFTLNKIGKFSLTVYKTINGLECSSSKQFTVKHPNSPSILKIDVDTQNEIENTVYVSVNGNSSYEFSLDNTNFTGNGSSHTFTNIAPGISTIYIRDIKKCESSITASASIIGYPKFLTPNSDNNNDSWYVYGVNSSFFKEINIKIFNRFGKILHVINSKNAETGWDGTYNGKTLPSDEYWFHAKLKDLNDNIIDKKGHFSLMRK